MAEIKQKNTWQTVVIILFTLLSVYFVISIKNSNTSHKKEIKLLEVEKRELQKELENKIDKDSIYFYLIQQAQLDSIIKQLTTEIDNFNNIEYEENIDFSFLSVDSNVAFFTRKFNESNPN